MRVWSFTDCVLVTLMMMMIIDCFSNINLAETYFDRDVEVALLAASKSVFQKKTLPYLWLANQVGNMYTPSLYGGLASFIAR